MSKHYTPILKQKYRILSPQCRSCKAKQNLNTIAEESAELDEMSFIFQTSEMDDYYQAAAKIADKVGLKNCRRKWQTVWYLAGVELFSVGWAAEIKNQGAACGCALQWGRLLYVCERGGDSSAEKADCHGGRGRWGYTFRASAAFVVNWFGQ